MNFWAEVLMHIASFMSVLPILYFGFVAPQQTNKAATDLFVSAKPELTDYAIVSGNTDTGNVSSLIQQISSLNFDSQLSEESAKIIEDNKGVVLGVGVIFGLCIPLLIAFSVIIEYYYGHNVFELLISNLIFISFVILSEFLIVGIFLNNYVELDGSYLKSVAMIQFNSNGYPWVDPNIHGAWCKFSRTFTQSLIPQSLQKFFYPDGL